MAVIYNSVIQCGWKFLAFVMEIVRITKISAGLCPAFMFCTICAQRFHSCEPTDDDGILPPILDTCATHCLLPIKRLTNEQSLFSMKPIHEHQVVHQCEY